MTETTIEQCRIHVQEDPHEQWRVHIPAKERRRHDIETGVIYGFTIDGTPQWSTSVPESGQVTIPKRIRDKDGFDFEPGEYVDVTVEK